MTGWIIVQVTKQLIAQLLIEAQGLKIEGIQIGMTTAAPLGFLFCRLHQLSTITQSAQAIGHP